MAIHTNVMGLILNPKLTYSTHIHNISVHAHMSLQIINALTSTGWRKQKETLMGTYPSHLLHKHATYFKIPRLNILSSTTPTTQQIFPQTPTQSLQQT